MFAELSNYGRDTALIKFIAMGGTFNGQGDNLSRAITKVIHEPRFNEGDGARFYLISEATVLLEEVDHVFEEIPRLVAICIGGAVFLLSGIAFR